MRRSTLILGLGAVCMLAPASLSGAATSSTTWTAALSSGQEVPRQAVKNTAARGLFKGTLSGNSLRWKLTYSHLTGPAMQAHIHVGAKGKSGPVVVPLCGGTPACKSGISGTAKLAPQLLAQFKSHLLYVNVHTAKNPNGEIRGQLARG